MARPREFDRDAVVDQAILLFWRQGYRGTSIQDVVTATGVNRGSLYASFGDKAGLFAAAVDRYIATGNLQRRIEAAGEAGDGRPVRAVLAEIFAAFVEAGAGDPDRRGCLLTNTAVELSPREDAAARVAENLRGLEDALADALARGQGRGEIAAGRDPRALARFVVAAIQGLRVMSKVAPERERLQDIADETLAHLAP